MEHINLELLYKMVIILVFG